jgi:hypothetical protein
MLSRLFGARIANIMNLTETAREVHAESRGARACVGITIFAVTEKGVK